MTPAFSQLHCLPSARWISFLSHSCPAAGCYRDTHFTERKTEAQREDELCSALPSWNRTAPGWNSVLGHQLHLLSAVPTQSTPAAAETGATTGLRWRGGSIRGLWVDQGSVVGASSGEVGPGIWRTELTGLWAPKLPHLGWQSEQTQGSWGPVPHSTQPVMKQGTAHRRSRGLPACFSESRCVCVCLCSRCVCVCTCVS